MIHGLPVAGPADSDSGGCAGLQASAPPPSSTRAPLSVLLVDDDPEALRALARDLRRCGFEVAASTNAVEAAALARDQQFDIVISDINMPEINGMDLLRRIRQRDLMVPIVLVTGQPKLETAVQALQYGAFDYLIKPVRLGDLVKVVDRAGALHRMAQLKQLALEALGTSGPQALDRAGLEASFARAMDTLWMAYQPIVHAPSRSIFGYEALLRSSEPSLPHPGAVIEAAESLGLLRELGRGVRSRAAAPFCEDSVGSLLFVNLHPRDLLDPELSDPKAPLSSIANNVVLELTERAALSDLVDVKARVAELRELGFRIAVDDLGAGYAGLTSFALLEPEIIKLDMTLVRDVDSNITKQKVVRSMTQLTGDLGITLIAEGVETAAERDTLLALGCHHLQGYFFGRPAREFGASFG